MKILSATAMIQLIRDALCLLLIGALSGCTIIGVGGGALLDSASKKKADKITTEDQRITLQYTGGTRVKARYRGLVYYPDPSHISINQDGNNFTSQNAISLPAIGEDIAMTFADSSQTQEGKFAGIGQSGKRFVFKLDTNQQNIQNIPLSALHSITLSKGEILTNFPGPDRILLLYEANNQIYRAPLSSIRHINYRETKNMLIMGVVGLIADVTIVLIASQMTYDLLW